MVIWWSWHKGDWTFARRWTLRRGRARVWNGAVASRPLTHLQVGRQRGWPARHHVHFGCSGRRSCRVRCQQHRHLLMHCVCVRSRRYRGCGSRSWIDGWADRRDRWCCCCRWCQFVRSKKAHSVMTSPLGSPVWEPNLGLDICIM